ncbi:curlin [Allorhizobium sp. BGMRC 0089]|uniref:curlin n=1 Tax=Allorhizobium sonneratiae TaxID=2934936 RepID=UPI0020337EB3|nr:curlin [Allorhizobium sonneratiae]MCM2291833.1 curlin [Allorhizobium sonneratiae]
MSLTKPRIAVKTLAVTLLVAGLGQAALTAPAEAGGWFSLNLAPANAEDASLMSSGLQLYSLYRGIRGGSIEQSGYDNRAGLAQQGRGNLGIIQQHGNGHSATLRQTGHDNSYGIFQYGRNSDNEVVQNGNGGTGMTFSYGW